ncbi:MAG: Holliday junction branch migration protein RuvA [Anaerolineaceae bacterium]|jgi:Holliday junction DNA helicase RuvA
MIASLSGDVVGVENDSLVVSVGGVGLRVYVTPAVRAQYRVGEPIHLHTHLVVREDMLALYGFEREAERSFFLLLLGVNGVGPRLALNILSALSVDAIRRAVQNEQPEMFGRVPGVGKKTGQKIILYLQGKVGEGMLGEGLPVSDVDTEVMEALTALGYSVVEAQAAIQSIPLDTAQEVESRLRVALQYFSR